MAKKKNKVGLNKVEDANKEILFDIHVGALPTRGTFLQAET